MGEKLIHLNTPCPRCGSTLFYKAVKGETYCAGKILTEVDKEPSLCGYTIIRSPKRGVGGRYPKARKCKVCGSTELVLKNAYCEKHLRMKALQNYRMRKRTGLQDKKGNDVCVGDIIQFNKIKDRQNGEK